MGRAIGASPAGRGDILQWQHCEPPSGDSVIQQCTRRRRLAAFLILGILCATPAAAQRPAEVAAWSALMVTPIGALAPIAQDPHGLPVDASAWSLRYGRWNYDDEDVIHDTGGLTWSRGLAFRHLQLSVTGAYALIECPTCSYWLSGDITIRSPLSYRIYEDSATHLRTETGASIQLSLGGSRYRGREPANAQSLALTMPLDVAVPFGRTGAWRASLIPGIGFGRVATAGTTDAGVLPMLGGALAWSFNRSFSIDMGLQRVILRGGALQIGLGARRTR